MDFSLAHAWPDVVAGFALASAAYASTNFDNLLLMASAAARKTDRRTVIQGFVLSTTVVLGLSVAFVAVSELLSPRALGLLGLFPILIGIRLLLSLSKEPGSAALPAIGILPMGLALMANSTDTLAVFGPLLAESKPAALVAMLLAYLLMAAIWITLALHISARLAGNKSLLAIAGWVTPIVMILLGVYILLDTTTDTVVAI